MRPWREGDPVGAGEVYLPDTKTKQAYANACKRIWLDSAAHRAISLPTLQLRREFINNYPAKEREALKDKIRKLWEENK